MKRIKKSFVCLMCAMMLAGCQSTAAAETENTETETVSVIDGFSDWAIAGGNAGTYSGQFLHGVENRPTDEELEKMLQAANTYFQCHGLSGTHFVVVKDVEEQYNMIPFFGNDYSGTVTVLVLSDGLKSQEYHDAQYYPGSTEVNGGNPEYWNMYYGIYESGWASAYLNLAAIDQGYRTRAYAALNIENLDLGEVNLGSGGQFQFITKENWDIEKYMTSKDGTESFDHYVTALDDTIALDGNVTLLCAIVIGKVDEADTVTSTTMRASYKAGMSTNYDFWDKDYTVTNEEIDSVTGASQTTEEE